MVRYIFASFLSAGSAAVFACGGGTTVVDVAEYDRSCQADADCVVVRDGDICCGCPNAAINEGDLEKYQGDLGECEAQCDIACLGNLVAFCNEGTCDVREVETLCTPDEEVFCSCSGGAQGTKTCLPDGSAFGDCACP